MNQIINKNTNREHSKTALILEGGGMRGLFTAGVIDAFIEKKTFFDEVYGVSAGSCHAISFLSSQKGRAERVNIDYCTRSDYFGVNCLIHEKSMFGWNLLFNLIPNKLDPVDYSTFFSNLSQSKLFITVTNALTGSPEYFTPKTKEELLLFARASCSLPFLCPSVIINSIPYFDGGIADSIPIRKAIDNGCTNFVIVLTRSPGYRKQPESFSLFSKLIYHKYPKLIESMHNRYKNYNESLDIVSLLEKEKKAVVIRPPEEVNVSRLERDPAKLSLLCKTGYDLGLNIF